MGQATESVVTCQVKVETGLTDSKGSTKSKKDSSVKTAEKQKTTDVDKTTTVDKNFRMYFEESASFGFEIPVVKDIFSAGFKVTQSFAIDKNTQNTVQDQVKVRLSFAASLSRAPRARGFRGISSGRASLLRLIGSNPKIFFVNFYSYEWCKPYAQIRMPSGHDDKGKYASTYPNTRTA